MKKWIAAVLAAIMCTALFAGCNDKEDTESAGSGATKVLFMSEGNILEQPPQEFFGNPEHPRLRDFLSKVLIRRINMK